MVYTICCIVLRRQGFVPPIFMTVKVGMYGNNLPLKKCIEFYVQWELHCASLYTSDRRISYFLVCVHPVCFTLYQPWSLWTFLYPCVYIQSSSEILLANLSCVDPVCCTLYEKFTYSSTLPAPCVCVCVQSGRERRGRIQRGTGTKDISCVRGKLSSTQSGTYQQVQCIRRRLTQ